MRTQIIPLVLLVVGGVSYGAEPIATVSSNTSFQLRGVQIDGVGVSRWPVMAGDTITSGTSATVLQFRDGSRVSLDQGAKASVVAVGDQVSFRLISGTMKVSPASGTRISFSGVTGQGAEGGAASKGFQRARLTAPPPGSTPVALSNR
jgi:hypothetical protein